MAQPHRKRRERRPEAEARSAWMPSSHTPAEEGRVAASRRGRGGHDAIPVGRTRRSDPSLMPDRCRADAQQWCAVSSEASRGVYGIIFSPCGGRRKARSGRCPDPNEKRSTEGYGETAHFWLGEHFKSRGEHEQTPKPGNARGVGLKASIVHCTGERPTAARASRLPSHLHLHPKAAVVAAWQASIWVSAVGGPPKSTSFVEPLGATSWAEIRSEKEFFDATARAETTR